MAKKLLQIHHEFRDGTTEMCAQREIGSQKELEAFFKDTQASHPLPENAKWLVVPEDSPRFVWAKAAEGS